MPALDGPILKGAFLAMPVPTKDLAWPYVVTSPEDELLACRSSAWIGVSLSTGICTYDIWGDDLIELLNYATVNRDYAKLKVGGSRHSLFCNDQGLILADGVLMRLSETKWRSYFLAPALSYYVEVVAPQKGWDVHGEFVLDEFFIQVDGPKSLEIMEKAAKRDLHHLRFAQNDIIDIDGVECTIHRLGMSGCLAYEIHGPRAEMEHVYGKILEAGEEFGIRRLGVQQYTRNHTQGGYPNQFIHYQLPWYASWPEFADYMDKYPFFPPRSKHPLIFGSASDDPMNAYVNPFDVGWDYLIDWNHDFVGKAALEQLRDGAHRTCVTLEWNASDIGRAFAKRFEGEKVNPEDDISTIGDGGMGAFYIISQVLRNGCRVGISAGRIRDYYHRRMISLAWVDQDAAAEGTELEIVWGTSENQQMPIRATVASFPYYDEDLRNETFDVEAIPHPAL